MAYKHMLINVDMQQVTHLLSYKAVRTDQIARNHVQEAQQYQGQHTVMPLSTPIFVILRAVLHCSFRPRAR